MIELPGRGYASMDVVAQAYQEAVAGGEDPAKVFSSLEAFSDWINERLTKGSYAPPPFLAKPEGEEDDLHLLCPPGIGDVAWVWAKWQFVAQDREKNGLRTRFWFPPDEPYRVGAYADIVGMDHGKMQGLHTHWMLNCSGDPGEVPESGVFVIHANKHLEEGKPLETWCPYLPTGPFLPETYDHAPEMGSPVVVHMAHAGYMEGNLLYGMWARIIRRLYDLHGAVLLTGGNAQSDQRFAQHVMDLLDVPVTVLFDAPLAKVLRCIGKAPLMVGMASGLEILSVDMGCPTVIAYPRWLHKMPGTWEGRRHLANTQSLFTDELYDWIMLCDNPDGMISSYRYYRSPAMLRRKLQKP